MRKEDQDDALSIDSEFLVLRDKVIDIERLNHFFYEATNAEIIDNQNHRQDKTKCS